MPKALTYEQVKNIVENKGYSLLSKEYINAAKKLLIKCNNGHEFYMTIEALKKCICPHCSYEKSKTRYVEKQTEIVKKILQEHNHILLDGGYVNKYTKMKIKCNKCNTEYSIKYGQFKKKPICRICEAHKPPTLEDAQKLVDARPGYVLLNKHDPKFKNCRSKLHVKCGYGHEYFVSYDSFLKNSKCITCLGGKKHTIEEAKAIIESNEGYTLLSTEYKHNDGELLISCKNKHIFKSSYKRFVIQKARCPECSSTKKYTFEEVEKIVNNINGFSLLCKKEEYINSKKKIKFHCDKGNHDFYLTFSRFNSKRLCPKCNNQTTRKEYSFIKEYIEKRGYTLLSTEYKNGNAPLEIICDNKHKTSITYNKIKRGDSCPECNLSLLESITKDFLKLHTKYNWKKIRPDWLKYTNGYNLEIDFWCDELGVGIEVQGKQHYEYVPKFHTEELDFKRQQERDEFKRNKFKEFGKKLIEIKTDDKYYNNTKKNFHKILKEILLKNGIELIEPNKKFI